MQILYFAISFLGNMAMLMAAYFFAHQRHVGEITVEEDQRSDTDIGAALAFVTISSVLSWICHYAYYSIFGHPWEAFQSNFYTSILISHSCIPLIRTFHSFELTAPMLQDADKWTTAQS